MPVPEQLNSRLDLPVVAAPMFLASSQELVFECCTNGIVGTFPALNERTSEAFENRLKELKEKLAAWEEETGKKASPFGVNLVVHRTNPRFEADLALCVKYEVPLVITSMGKASQVVENVHSYGGLVFHDVINLDFARKALEEDVDGVIAVCAGAGGHGGDLSPFVLVHELRQIFNGTILVGGGISTGQDVLAAQVAGADLAYVGTKFLGAKECSISDGYRDMVVECSASDIVYTDKVTGVPHNFLLPSLQRAGIDLPQIAKIKKDSGKDLDVAQASGQKNEEHEKKAWKDIWSCGQGVGSIASISSTSVIISQMKEEYKSAVNNIGARSEAYL